MTAPWFVTLLGLLPEVRELVVEVVKAIRDGRPDDAAKAAQRAAEVTAFKVRHGWRP